MIRSAIDSNSWSKSGAKTLASDNPQAVEEPGGPVGRDPKIFVERSFQAVGGALFLSVDRYRVEHIFE